MCKLIKALFDETKGKLPFAANEKNVCWNFNAPKEECGKKFANVTIKVINLTLELNSNSRSQILFITVFIS